MQYLPCNSALLAQEALFLPKKALLFGPKIFVRVQTFRRVPPVLPRNFCHPGIEWDCFFLKDTPIFYIKKIWDIRTKEDHTLLLLAKVCCVKPPQLPAQSQLLLWYLCKAVISRMLASCFHSVPFTSTFLAHFLLQSIFECSEVVSIQLLSVSEACSDFLWCLWFSSFSVSVGLKVFRSLQSPLIHWSISTDNSRDVVFLQFIPT